MTPDEFIQHMADLIVEMEEEAGCVGATGSHLKSLIADSIKAERNENYVPALMLENYLQMSALKKEQEIEFKEITDELFDPNELEAIFGGDKK